MLRLRSNVFIRLQSERSVIKLLRVGEKSVYEQHISDLAKRKFYIKTWIVGSWDSRSLDRRDDMNQKIVENSNSFLTFK